MILATCIGGFGVIWYWMWVWFNLDWVFVIKFGFGWVVGVGLGRWFVGLGVKSGNVLKYWVGLWSKVLGLVFFGFGFWFFMVGSFKVWVGWSQFGSYSGDFISVSAFG